MKLIDRLNPRAPGFAAAAIRLMVDQVRSVAAASEPLAEEC
jgi:hypothetical protein